MDEAKLEAAIQDIEQYALRVIPQVKSAMLAQITQIEVNRSQIALIADQKKYSKTIKRATWVIAAATLVQVGIALLLFFREPAPPVVIRQVPLEAPPATYTPVLPKMQALQPSPRLP